MHIQTVCGDISYDIIGITLPHEHLYFNAWDGYYSNDNKELNKEKRELCNQKLCMRNLGKVRRYPGTVKENLIMDDIDLMVKEISYFKDVGGTCIVDASSGSYDYGQYANIYKEMSERSGVHIVASTGFYLAETLPKEVLEKSEVELANVMIKNITEGFDDTGIKAGMISEVGAPGEFDDGEIKILRASAMAQKETGACITLHTACPNQFYKTKNTDNWGQRAIKILDILEKGGASVDRVIVGHADVSVDTSVEEQLSVLKAGAYLAYDNFSQEHAYDRENTHAPSDWQRIQNLISFINQGYIKQAVISTDLWQRVMLVEYGGWGLAHIIENICPMLKRNGLSDSDIECLLVENPRRILSI